MMHVQSSTGLGVEPQKGRLMKQDRRHTRWSVEEIDGWRSKGSSCSILIRNRCQLAIDLRNEASMQAAQ